MCINTQINFVCGHSAKIRRYTSLHCRLNRHGSPLTMEWRNRTCLACRGKEFRKDMIRIVEWLDKVGTYEVASARNSRVGSDICQDSTSAVYEQSEYS